MTQFLPGQTHPRGTCSYGPLHCCFCSAPLLVALKEWYNGSRTFQYALPPSPELPSPSEQHFKEQLLKGKKLLLIIIISLFIHVRIGTVSQSGDVTGIILHLLVNCLLLQTLSSSSLPFCRLWDSDRFELHQRCFLILSPAPSWVWSPSSAGRRQKGRRKWSPAV